MKNKKRFDKHHRLRPRAIQEDDWVLVYDSSLDNQYSAHRKLSKRWFGPYMVKVVHENATYTLAEMDGTMIKIPIASKRIKLFKRRESSTYELDDLDKSHVLEDKEEAEDLEDEDENMLEEESP